MLPAACQHANISCAQNVRCLYGIRRAVENKEYENLELLLAEADELQLLTAEVREAKRTFKGCEINLSRLHHSFIATLEVATEDALFDDVKPLRAALKAVKTHKRKGKRNGTHKLVRYWLLCSQHRCSLNGGCKRGHVCRARRGGCARRRYPVPNRKHKGTAAGRLTKGSHF